MSMSSFAGSAEGWEVSSLRALDRVALRFLRAIVSEACCASAIFEAGLGA